ncbi:MAG: sigma-54 interaction domain-containing protein, partial [Clostridia bacterium]
NVGNVLTFHDVTRIQELESKIREKIYTRGHIAKHSFDNIIGESGKLNEVIQAAKKFSRVESNVLVVGETGTGKELFAQSMHNFSHRKSGPFVAVNCAALPENLLESEMFGYVEGAFTGAIKGGKPGLFELAHRGTIFLDEISEISLKLQGQLLRVLQEKEIRRIGHDRIIPVDVRVISATNKELSILVQKGMFREDLYYRLDILKINIPPLRERKTDIPLLAKHFIREFQLLLGKEDYELSAGAIEALMSHEWSGNIRHLRNMCERLVVLSECNLIEENDIKAVILNNNIDRPACTSQSDNFTTFSSSSYMVELKQIEREKIKNELERSRYNKSKAAKSLGISRATLWRRMKEMNIEDLKL